MFLFFKRLNNRKELEEWGISLQVRSKMSTLTNREVAYRMPKHCTLVYNSTRTDFTTVGNYSSDNFLNEREVSRNPVHTLNRNLAGMCAT